MAFFTRLVPEQKSLNQRRHANTQNTQNTKAFKKRTAVFLARHLVVEEMRGGARCHGVTHQLKSV